MIKNYEIHEGSLYDYTSGAFCGVLVNETAMRKLVKLQAKHLENVRRVLSDEADKGNVFPSAWTLHYPHGNQKTVHFIDKSADIKQRIKAATNAHQVSHRPLVFVAGSMSEANEMADARHESLSEEVSDEQSTA